MQVSFTAESYFYLQGKEKLPDLNEKNMWIKVLKSVTAI